MTRFTIRIRRAAATGKTAYLVSYQHTGKQYAVADTLDHALTFVDWYHRSYRKAREAQTRNDTTR